MTADAKQVLKVIEVVGSGWIYVCDDGTYARQVVVQVLKCGGYRLVCENAGGQSRAISELMIAEVEEMIRKGLIDVL